MHIYTQAICLDEKSKGLLTKGFAGGIIIILFFSKMILMLLQILQHKSFKKHMALALFLLVCIVMNAEVWSGNEICFGNKGSNYCSKF